MILECKREATRQELIDRCNYLQEEIDKMQIGYEYSCESHQEQINILNDIIDAMARAICSYDSQLVINRYKDKEHVKSMFWDYVTNK